ncbi:hypothetical protein BKA80DRAFT_257478 [Phyllosticta citrichinensis]
MGRRPPPSSHKPWVPSARHFSVPRTGHSDWTYVSPSTSLASPGIAIICTAICSPFAKMTVVAIVRPVATFDCTSSMYNPTSRNPVPPLAPNMRPMIQRMEACDRRLTDTTNPIPPSTVATLKFHTVGCATTQIVVDSDRTAEFLGALSLATLPSCKACARQCSTNSPRWALAQVTLDSVAGMVVNFFRTKESQSLCMTGLVPAPWLDCRVDHGDLSVGLPCSRRSSKPQRLSASCTGKTSHHCTVAQARAFALGSKGLSCPPFTRPAASRTTMALSFAPALSLGQRIQRPRGRHVQLNPKARNSVHGLNKIYTCSSPSVSGGCPILDVPFRKYFPAFSEPERGYNTLVWHSFSSSIVMACAVLDR